MMDLEAITWFHPSRHSIAPRFSPIDWSATLDRTKRATFKYFRSFGAGLCTLAAVASGNSSSATAQDVYRPLELPDWSDTQNVPGHFSAPQDVCDARRRLIGWPTQLVFVLDAGASWKGSCRAARADGSTDIMATPFKGAKCPIAYYIPMAEYVDVRSDIYDNRYIYSASGPCVATVPVLDRYHDKPLACQTGFGHPIFPLTGSKRLRVVLDKLGLNTVYLVYDTRSKVSTDAPWAPLRASPSPSFGALWQSSIHKRLVPQTQIGQARTMIASRGIAAWTSFVTTDGVTYTTDSDNSDRLVSYGSGWLHIDAANRTQEVYGADGSLVLVAGASGGRLTYAYTTESLLSSLEDNFGRSLQFTYEQVGGSIPRVKRMTTSSGGQIAFDYDAAGSLRQITWPDMRALRFVYEDPNSPWALTGVIDESGGRVATYGYDRGGRAVDTQLAGGVDHYRASWEIPPSWHVTETYDARANVIWRDHNWIVPQGTKIQTPNGTVTSIGALGLWGMPRVGYQTQPGGSGCAAATSAQNYDANGNVSVRDDFNGFRTCYANDMSRNLEVFRVEGLNVGTTCASVAGPALPAGARKVSTQWHPDWSLPIKVAEPGRITTYVYNGQADPFSGGALASCAPPSATLPAGKRIAVLCRQVEQATVDVNGSMGFDAEPQTGVLPREHRWAYNGSGQMMSSIGPLGDTTSYVYYVDSTFSSVGGVFVGHTRGDLQSSSNAVGHVTGYTQYDKAGNIMVMVDPNGMLTRMQYDARQRLISATVDGQTSTYEYWPTGLLKRATQPDGSYTDYSYDDAHRLTKLSDNLGNSIAYVLDDSGNRIAEALNDATGSLRSQINRVMDALNRVQLKSGR